jgi:hypothetical protein
MRCTIGSDCNMADWNKDVADGTASRVLIMLAPLLCPAMVILELEPPKDGMTVRKNDKAVTTSLTARFVGPPGAMKPS